MDAKGRAYFDKISLHLNRMIARQGYERIESQLLTDLAMKGRSSERNQRSFMAHHVGTGPGTGTGRILIVFFSDINLLASVGNEEVGIVGQVMLAYQSHKAGVRAMIITKIPVSSSAQRTIAGLEIQVWRDIDLMYDPTESVFNSRILNPSMKVDELDGVRPGLLPRLESTDIMAKYYGVSAGSAVRFQRYNMTPGDLLETEDYIRILVGTRVVPSR